jgi:hypothetical protein
LLDVELVRGRLHHISAIRFPVQEPLLDNTRGHKRRYSQGHAILDPGRAEKLVRESEPLFSEPRVDLDEVQLARLDDANTPATIVLN